MPLVRKDLASSVTPRNDSKPAQLRSGTADERWAAVRALSAEGAVDELIGALGIEEDPRVREAILTRLASTETVAAIDAILLQLRSNQADIRTAALDALRTVPNAVRSRLPDLLKDGDRDVRLLSCEIARALPASDVEEMLCTLLEEEEDANVCGAAVEVLAEIGTPRSLPALVHCAGRYPSDAFLRFSIDAASEQIGIRPIVRP